MSPSVPLPLSSISWIHHPAVSFLENNTRQPTFNSPEFCPGDGIQSLLQESTFQKLIAATTLLPLDSHHSKATHLNLLLEKSISAFTSAIKQPGIHPEIGQGTYSSVYKARDLITGKIVALKKVRFVNLNAESIRFMAREIYVLRRLDHPNVIKLEGLVASKMSSSLWLIFQYMEHDLAGLAARPGIGFTLSQVKCFMEQLFIGLNHCHNNGVLHRDIKGANLLISDDGILKISDFGLATFFSTELKHPLTSRVVTLWYRPPELLLGAQDYGISVDLWSSGCILAELLAGKPIMPGRTEVRVEHIAFFNKFHNI
ncbi:putative serine/threonine-protein kinase [Platanthera guangdongensis]|uniref:[RNA-polymerase]-subunit kinase n=1 Tax=Platanthera guangdongensis TaxID=2320717 RepID=A0ABR2MT02_9ASPA